MDLHIKNLRDVPHVLPTLASWHHSMWSYLYPGDTLALRTERMQSYLAEDFLPSTFVALWGDEPVGSAAIISCDMETHTHLTPWMASLYVSEQWRQKGIGGTLVKHITAACEARGIPRIYLFTPDKRTFYERLGWECIATPDYHGERVTVMQRLLAP
ncbi:GNAT family N-acetyltransferase [Myxococcota bacterium]|nr:GNAT family N-acetyltransferase [Myxococcota bacterium]MBU1536599.1 GNAT family N-acetyltransferase [Myxococcota bacterium]